MVTLVKEIGSDALFGLLRVLEGERARAGAGVLRALPRPATSRWRWRRPTSRAIARWPRTRKPIPTSTCTWSRSAPTASSCAARSATRSISANAHEIIVLPTRAMGPDDADYAVVVRRAGRTRRACRCTSRPTARGDHDEFEFPVSSKHKMLETLTVFDDVFVPWERVFVLPRARAARAGVARASSSTTASPRCRTSCRCSTRSSAPPRSIAEMNGVVKAGHIRDKLTQLDHLRGDGARAHRHGRAPGAGRRPTASPTPTRSPPTWPSTPSPRSTTPRCELVQDCAGGLLVTGPGGDDWANPEVRAVLEKYLRGQGAGRGAAPAAQHHQRPHRPRLRRLPRRARRARRGLDRGREDADLPGLRTRTSRRIRATARGPGLEDVLASPVRRFTRRGACGAGRECRCPWGSGRRARRACRRGTRRRRGPLRTRHPRSRTRGARVPTDGTA